MEPTEQERLPQFRDRVEFTKANRFGEVRDVRKSEVKSGYSFFVLFDGGNSGWYAASELRIVALGPASDPAAYTN